jgi:lipopolysaccharide transport system permease protein
MSARGLLSRPAALRPALDETTRPLKHLRPPAFSLWRLGADLRLLVQYRDLLYTLSLHRIKVRYKQSVLGVAWALLQPVSLMLIYSLIFVLIVRVPSEGTPYALFAYAGLLPWTLLATSLSNATNGLVSHQQLVTKVYFPREIITLTYVIAALFDFLIAATVLAGLLLWYDVPLTWNLLWTLPLLGVLLCFISAGALAFSAAQVRWRDIGVGLPLLLQLWMFATPIVYPLSAVPARLRPLYQLNPLVSLIENFRRVTLHGSPPELFGLATAAGVSLALFVLAYLYFKTVEATMADVI